MTTGILREENFMKYIRVDWPESQEWYEYPEVVMANASLDVFVPEELYNRVKNK